MQQVRMPPTRFKQAQILALGTILTVTTSCVFIRMDDSFDLGDRYRYQPDYPQCIINQEMEEHVGTGPYVVTPVVNAYNFNDRYIIARSKEEIVIRADSLAETPTNYWIIDKKVPFVEGSYQSMDSVAFFYQLSKRKINLSLKMESRHIPAKD
ncbi:hypothetical protein BH09BAC4_BH09BAC4_00600 [soil metagenome]